MKTSIFITMNDYGTCDGPRDGEEKGRTFSLSVFHIPSDEAVVKHLICGRAGGITTEDSGCKV